MTRYEELLGEQQDKQSEDLEIYVPPGPRLGELVVEAKGLAKAFGDKVLFEDVEFDLPSRRHRGRDWPERRGQNDAVSDDCRKGKTGPGHPANRRDGQARLCRSGSDAGSQQDGMGSDFRRSGHAQAGQG